MIQIDVIFNRTHRYASNIRNAINLVNFHQTEFYMKEFHDDLSFLKRRQSSLYRDEECVVYEDALQSIRDKFPGKRCVVVLDISFSNNFFSDTSPDVSIITTHSWSEHFAPPSVKVFLAREFTLAFLCGCGDLNEDDISNICLQESRGCLFDFCK